MLGSCLPNLTILRRASQIALGEYLCVYLGKFQKPICSYRLQLQCCWNGIRESQQHGGVDTWCQTNLLIESAVWHARFESVAVAAGAMRGARI